MPHGTVTIRTVVEFRSRQLVKRVAEALEDAEMEATGALLGQQLAARQGFEMVIRHGCVRLALRPFAQLMVLEIIEIACRPALPTSAKERLAREAMVDAGYA